MVHKRAPQRLYGINVLSVRSKVETKWTRGKCKGQTYSMITERVLLFSGAFSAICRPYGPQNDFAPVEKRTDTYEDVWSGVFKSL